MIPLLVGLYVLCCVVFVLNLKRAPLGEEGERGFRLTDAPPVRVSQPVVAVAVSRPRRAVAPSAAMLEQAFR